MQSFPQLYISSLSHGPIDRMRAIHSRTDAARLGLHPARQQVQCRPPLRPKAHAQAPRISTCRQVIQRRDLINALKGDKICATSCSTSTADKALMLLLRLPSPFLIKTP